MKHFANICSAEPSYYAQEVIGHLKKKDMEGNYKIKVERADLQYGEVDHEVTATVFRSRRFWFARKVGSITETVFYGCRTPHIKIRLDKGLVSDGDLEKIINRVHNHLI